MTEWIDFRKKPPEKDIIALVFNEKGFMCGGDIIAMYILGYNVWKLFDPYCKETFTLEVTHYLPIPPCPEIF